MENAYPAEALKKRSKRFAIRVIRLFQALPKTDAARTLGRQLLPSATGVAANYRAVCRARSKAEFIAKIGIVVEEADETVFWLEPLVESGIVPQGRMHDIQREATELLAIFAASQRTVKVGTRTIGSMKQ